VSYAKRTSVPSGRRSSRIRWWLAAVVVLSLVVPAGAQGWIMGSTSQSPATETGAAERTVTELAQRIEEPAPANADEGFSWGDAGIGAGAVAGLVALTGAAYVLRRRAQPSPRPAV
jgi:hypothetical protein